MRDVMSTKATDANRQSKSLTFNEWVDYYHLKKMEYEFNLQNQMLDEFNLDQNDFSKILQEDIKYQ